MVAGGLGVGVALVGAGVVSLGGGAAEGVLLGGAPGVVLVVVPVTADKENASIICLCLLIPIACYIFSTTLVWTLNRMSIHHARDKTLGTKHL